MIVYEAFPVRSIPSSTKLEPVPFVFVSMYPNSVVRLLQKLVHSVETVKMACWIGFGEELGSWTLEAGSLEFLPKV